MKTFSVEAIGVIRSEIKNIEDAPLFYTEGAPNAFLDIFPAYLQAWIECKSATTSLSSPSSISLTGKC